MTEKLYYVDSYIFEFSATIAAIEEIAGKTAVILDKTAFFPEGGGQSADTGFISDAFIYDVQENNGLIYHFTKELQLPAIGDTVSCRIDKVQRFERMQAHSGEHIISGIAHSLFDADNVGFHMDGTLMTVDFNIPLTAEQLHMIEEKANECIYSNLRIDSFILTAEEASVYDYRSKLEFTDDVRLVRIENTDLCACCAPHVKHTGEIGIVKILSSASHRGGTRITLVCGRSAYRDYCMKHNSTMSISAQLCSKHFETADAVHRLINANTQQKYEFSVRQKKLLDIIASEICAADIITEFYDGLSMDDIREICNTAKDKSEKLCMIFSGNDESGYSYCAYSEIADFASVIKSFNSACNGNGGGRGNMLQGRVKDTQEHIIDYFSELKV